MLKKDAVFQVLSTGAGGFYPLKVELQTSAIAKHQTSAVAEQQTSAVAKHADEGYFTKFINIGGLGECDAA